MKRRSLEFCGVDYSNGENKTVVVIYRDHNIMSYREVWLRRLHPDAEFLIVRSTDDTRGLKVNICWIDESDPV